MVKKMKYLKYFKQNNTRLLIENKGLFTLGEVFTIEAEDDKIKITEECDGYFSETFTPDKAIKMFEEAIEVVKFLSKR